MKLRRIWSLVALFFLGLTLVASCNGSPDSPSSGNSENGPPIVIGYSSWAGWWPWAIAEEEGLFADNGVNVQMKWFDGYLESLQALAAGQIDGNCQTLNDTVAFAPDSVSGQVVVLVNDNSAGNDKIIVSQEINSVKELKGKKVGIEEGLVDDFLLSLALEENGLSREDIEIVNLETGAAAAAFVAGQVDAVGAFPPFWLTALKRPGSKELVSSAKYPGAIPDLLVVTQNLVDEQPDKVQAIVNTWFDILAFMEENPERAEEILAQRANVSIEEFQKFKEGTKFFTIEDNLEAFSQGNSMKHMPFAAREMAQFMQEIGLIEKKPEYDALFDDRFVKAYAENKT